jgi:thiol-disulfide isomerase/thioredoxin
MNDMRWLKMALVAGVLSTAAWAGVVEDTRAALESYNFSAAEAGLQSYRAQHGITPEYLEAYSWLGRTAVKAREYDKALAYSKQTKAEVLAQLKTRKLDADDHLPTALGAAYEVEAQADVAQGRKAQAVEVLRAAIRTYGTTSIRARLQKNLNELTLAGSAAPELSVTQALGARSPALAQLKGKPVLLFFWAHWCADCKAEAPVIAQLQSDYASHGLTVIGPTRYYGYTAQIEHATPQQELPYIEAVHKQYYAGLTNMPVPVGAANFDRYGASTTPTLVLIDRAGKVAMYHPGAMTYAELRQEIEKVAR